MVLPVLIRGAGPTFRRNYIHGFGISTFLTSTRTHNNNNNNNNNNTSPFCTQILILLAHTHIET